MAEAARAWLDTLDAEQRAIGQGAVPADDPSDNERRRWFYTPTDHGGLTIHQQRPAQQRAAMRLVSTGLSPAAYVTVATIMGLENVLDYIEGFVARFDRERGRDPGLYYLRVFGDPGNEGLWGWRFGGHHVSLNNLVVDGVLVATTPCFLGANPATSPLLGGAVNRPLARVEDLGRDLVRSLRPDLAARAILLPKAPSDFVTANRTDVTDGDRVIPLAGIYRDERFPDPVEQAKLQALSDVIEEVAELSEADHEAVAYSIEPKGVPAAEFDAEQREMLRALLGYLPRSGTGRGVPAAPLRRRVGPRRRALRLGGTDCPGRAALLPAAGSPAPDRVGQHPEQRQPCSLGVARSHLGLRSRCARPPPRGASCLMISRTASVDSIASAGLQRGGGGGCGIRTCEGASTQPAFQVGCCTVHHGSRSPQMSAVPGPDPPLTGKNEGS